MTMRPSARTTSAANRLSSARPTAADQRPITAAQRQAGHADGADRARHGRKAERIGYCGNVGGTSAAGDPRGGRRGRRATLLHPAEVDDDAVAQGATGPIVTAAAHRQRKVTIARGSNGRLDIFGMSDSGRRRAACGRPALPRSPWWRRNGRRPASTTRPSSCSPSRRSVLSIRSVMSCFSLSGGANPMVCATSRRFGEKRTTDREDFCSFGSRSGGQLASRETP